MILRGIPIQQGLKLIVVGKDQDGYAFHSQRYSNTTRIETGTIGAVSVTVGDSQRYSNTTRIET